MLPKRFGRAFLRRLQDALPIQETDRVVIVVDVPDRPEIGEIQDRVLGEVGHVVDDTVRLIAVVPGYGRRPSACRPTACRSPDPTSGLHRTMSRCGPADPRAPDISANRYRDWRFRRAGAPPAARYW